MGEPSDLTANVMSASLDVGVVLYGMDFEPKDGGCHLPGLFTLAFLTPYTRVALCWTHWETVLEQFIPTLDATHLVSSDMTGHRGRKETLSPAPCMERGIVGPILSGFAL